MSKIQLILAVIMGSTSCFILNLFFFLSIKESTSNILLIQNLFVIPIYFGIQVLFFYVLTNLGETDTMPTIEQTKSPDLKLIKGENKHDSK